MSLFGELKKMANPVRAFKETIKLANLPGKKNKYSLLGTYLRGQDAKEQAQQDAQIQQQAQLDLLDAQQNAAKNALTDLSLKNTPDVIAGGTADMLLRTRKRKPGAGANSIATQLGL